MLKNARRLLKRIVGLFIFSFALQSFNETLAEETNVVEAIRAALSAHQTVSGRIANGVPSLTQTDPRATVFAEWLRSNLPAARLARSASSSLSTPPNGQTVATQQLRLRAGNDVEVQLRPSNGTAMQIKGRVLERAATGVALVTAGTREERTARNFLRSNRAIVRIDDPDNELWLMNQETDIAGNRHLRFSQTYYGLAVWPSGLSVHLDSSGNVYLMDGTYIATPSTVATQPKLSSKEAVLNARGSVANASAIQGKIPQMIIYAPLDAEPRL